MKNIFSKTTENRTQNGVKSYSFPTRLLSPILIFTFLTLGVGQMWAYNFYSPYIYFNNADLKWGDVMLLVGHNSYSCGYNATTNMISNTKLVYFAPDASWGDQDGFTVCKASNWACASEAFTARAGYATHIGLQYSYGFNYHESYYVTGNTSGTINISAGRPPSKDATQGAKWRDAGTSYSITTGTYPATLKLQGTYLSGNGKSARSTITSTASTDGDAKKVYGAVVTGEITHSFESLNSSYYFEGWGTGDTPSSTDATHTYNISENTTTYAFFSKTYTLTYDRKGTFGNSTLSVDVSNFNGTKESGSAIPTGHQITFTATPEFGYIIEGWYRDAECTVSLDNGQNPTYTISSLDADKSVYVKFEQLKTITIKFAHEAKDGWTIQGVRRYPESGGQRISANGKWVTIEFTNVYAVSNIDLAYSGGDWDYLNTATKITGDCCYNKDGSLNASCCVPPAKPTWGTAPKNGAIGGSMTASVSGDPADATITWSSTNPSAATVDNYGVIRYVATGNTTIKANVSWSATGDYCAGSYELSQEISVTSGATVTATRACPEYVSNNSGQVKLDISSTGASTGWYYRVCNSAKTAYYAPDEQSAANNTLSWTMNGALPTGSNTLVVELYNSARQLVCTSNPVTVNVEIAELVTISAGANGSVSPSGTVYANNNHVHPTITATPNEHYHFVNWTSNNAAASVADDNSATTTVTATASGYTITANFAGDKYTITYKDQGGVDYSGNNIGSLPATHTYGTATDLVNGTKEGFTFGGWYTDEACTVSAGSSIGATAKTSNFTLYAKWTEKMSTLSTSNSYSVGDPSFADPTKSVSSIGISTTATVTAHANELGFTLTGWTITGGTRTDGGAENANPITVRSNGDGAAVSVTANYVGSNTPVNIFLPNTGNNWDPSDVNWKFDKRPGDVGNTVTLAVDINKSDYESSNYKLGFNIFHADWEYKWWHNKHDGDSYMYAHNCTDWGFNTTWGDYRTYLDLNVSGTYTFTLKNSDNSSTQQLSVTYPDKSFIEGDFPTEWSEDAYTLTENGDIQSVTINITSTGDKQFRLVSHGKLFGTSTKITAAANSQTLSAKKMTDGGARMTLDAYVTGEYTFTYNKSTKNLTVTFPAAYTVTYGVGTEYSSMGEVSTTPNITSGDYVIEGREITFTATPNLGYKFVGWYSDDACTRSLSTDNPYTVSVTEEKNVYAKFGYRPLYIHADFAPNGWDTPVQMTQSTENRAVYTYEIDPLAAKSGTPATEGHHFHFVNTVENPNGNKAYNYKGVQTPTGSGFLTNDNIHLTDADNATIQFDLMRKSKITITLTLKSIDDDPKPTVNIAADPYYTVHTATGGSGAAGVTISPESVEARSGANSGEIIATIDPGYTFTNWTADPTITITSPNDPTTTVRATGEGTLIANATANSYTVHFDGNGNTGGLMNDMSALTYGVAFKLTANAFTKTGYTFAGWATEAAGAVAYKDGQVVKNLTDVKNGTATLYAKWTPNQYTVTLDKQTSAEGYGGDAGTVANQTVTFDAIPATVSSTMPTAKNGWAFMGFYSATGGNGRRFINPSGEWVANAGDTIRDSKWVYDGNVTLYAYYKKAQITNLIFDAAVVAPGAKVGVTPKVDPTPAGTNSICWKLLYNNGNLYTPQPEFRPANPGGVDNKVTFNAPPTSGMYLVAAVLRTGNECNGGIKLDSVTYPFQVAGDHTVTVQYKCGSEVIAPSTTVTGKPLEWTEVVAHDIFGYYFSGWTAGDGVTIEEAATGRLAELQAEDASIVAVIKMKAIYDGKLTANYSKRDYIYFKSTALGWNNVYVYFYTNNGYWNNDKGAGATGAACIGKGQMSLVPGETDIYYWDYGTGITGGPSAATKYVAFTWGDCTNHGNFYGNASSYPTNGNNQGFNAGTPMFVPISQEENYRKNENATPYYDRGYWTQYIGGTGYSIDIFHANGTYDKSINFEEGDSEGMPFTANVYLNGGSNLYFKVHRSSGMYYYSTTNVTMSNAATAMPLTYDSGASKKTTISTNVAGDYLFSLTCASDGKLNVTVKYPAKSGDYRLLYSDDIQTKPLASDVVHQENNSRDTVSFFVRPRSHPVLKIQKATVTDGGAITWSAGTDISSSLTSLTKDSVYNICLQMNESGAISVENVAFYTGNFYIRTDAAGTTKWDNYRAADHLMTYSEYSETYSDYTHYFVKFVREGTNVKFVVANDYSPCISDTLIRQTYRGGDSDHVDENGFLNGDLPGDGVNVRFMWDIRNNAVMRAYLAPAQKNGSKFLVLRSNSSKDLRDEYDVALTGDSEGFPGNNHGGGANCMQFVDNENWIYEATVMVRPSAYVKLYGNFHGTDFYFKGNNNDDFNDTEIDGIPNAIQLVTGSTGSRVKVRVIYDFKTDRLLAAMVPSGEISTEMAINADVMFIREHQGDIKQLIFNGSGKITDIKTAYAVMRFNKWTLNNKDKDTHTPLASPASIYERSLYYVSFPFPVNLSEVFGFGTYGQHWIIQRYRGDLRAQQGFWAESAGFWEFIWNRNGVVLQPNEGYILTLETELLGEESDVWGPDQRSNQIELFFPSTGPLGSITNATVNCSIPEHTCYINRHETEGLQDSPDPSTSYNRTIFDSHWNIMSVPTYVNVDDPSFANTTWIGGEKGNVGPKFLYTWNMDDNTLTATSGKGFMYHAMHAYTVQYYGDVTWTTSVTPTAAPQRNTEYRGEYEFCLEVQQDEQMIDRTYVRLSDDENVTTGFEFSEDMTKQFNSRKANIFTIAGNTSLGGNSLPLSTTQTTVVPVGVKIKTAGDYTFAIPEGTDGIGVTLVDNETGVRTLLSALDYTVNLTAGTHDGRFILEISPIQNTPTGMEDPTSDSSLKGRAQKRIIDGVLYIVKDGKIFDARGTRVE